MVIDLGLPTNFGKAMREAVKSCQRKEEVQLDKGYPMEPGSRTEVHELQGYKLVQNRPFACRPVCRCGECNGRSVTYPGTVVQTWYYADNSIETEVRCDDGVTRYIRHVAPHGDLCF